jgi:hypothetical protein
VLNLLDRVDSLNISEILGWAMIRGMVLLREVGCIQEFMPIHGGLDQGFLVGKYLADDGVDDNGRNEAVEPVKAVHVLGTLADSSVGVNGLCQSWKIGHHGNEEGDGRAPVDTGIVAVTALGIVQGWNVQLLAANKPVVGNHDTCNWREEHGVSSHKGEEGACGRQDLPWYNDPSANHGRDDAAALDVDVFGKENSEIVGGGDGVCGNVGSDLSNVPAEGSKEGSGTAAARSTVHPVINDVERVPQEVSVDDV